jgi:hypothetical protein
MAGHIEGESVVFDGPAPAADAVSLFDQDGVGTEMVCGAQASRAGAYDNNRSRAR